MNLKNILESLAKRILDDKTVVLDITNIAMLNDGDEFFESKSPTVLSIVNIEEDKILSNQSIYLKRVAGQDTVSKNVNHTKHLIISLLFSSYSKQAENYLNGLQKLNNVLSFFQEHTALYYNPSLLPDNPLCMIGYKNFNALLIGKENYTKIAFESVSLNMEQLNQLWSYLGSKYMPSVLLKMRLIPIQSDTLDGDKVIKEIGIKLWENNVDDPVGLIETINEKF